LEKIKGTRRTEIIATRCLSWAPNIPKLLLRPDRPCWGAYSAVPDPLAELWGLTSKGRGGGKRRKEEGREGKGMGRREGEGGRGEEGKVSNSCIRPCYKQV